MKLYYVWSLAWTLFSPSAWASSEELVCEDDPVWAVVKDLGKESVERVPLKMDYSKLIAPNLKTKESEWEISKFESKLTQGRCYFEFDRKMPTDRIRAPKKTQQCSLQLLPRTDKKVVIDCPDAPQGMKRMVCSDTSESPRPLIMLSLQLGLRGLVQLPWPVKEPNVCDSILFGAAELANQSLEELSDLNGSIKAGSGKEKAKESIHSPKKPLPPEGEWERQKSPRGGTSRAGKGVRH